MADKMQRAWDELPLESQGILITAGCGPPLDSTLISGLCTSGDEADLMSLAEQLGTPGCGVDLQTLCTLVEKLLEGADEAQHRHRLIRQRLDMPWRTTQYKLVRRERTTQRFEGAANMAASSSSIVPWTPARNDTGAWTSKRTKAAEESRDPRLREKLENAELWKHMPDFLAILEEHHMPTLQHTTKAASPEKAQHRLIGSTKAKTPRARVRERKKVRFWLRALHQRTWPRDVNEFLRLHRGQVGGASWQDGPKQHHCGPGVL